LPPSFSIQDLKDLFAPLRIVLSASVITDSTGKSLGMGAVEMTTPLEAERAIGRLHRSYVQGEYLLVFEQVEQEGAPGQENKGT
jgi:RNA recognition motif-containing protein